ncbi:hypothetical protein FPOAC2_13037 [Fusarium poae]|uniref:hypothetical protein n=1 Tax=Fusarium poae TaxID=36050 RepID=UPI001CE9C892|nr:hypothetical protein FPOAC1_012674 [Fusarium poae]KAG8667835.1 hypothetical protein FPOAC1_012674 [Fusarium poae]
MSDQTVNNGLSDNLEENLLPQPTGDSETPRHNPPLSPNTNELGLQTFLKSLDRSHSIELKVLGHIEKLQRDQELILELLRRKFEPMHDTPQIAKRLWADTENAWPVLDQIHGDTEYESVGSQFLLSLVPGGGRWLVSDEPNLVRARRVFEAWVRNTKSYSSPWRDTYSKVMETHIDNIEDWWPMSWASDAGGAYGASQEVSLAALGPSHDDPIDYESIHGQDIPSLLKTNKYSGIIYRISLDNSFGMIDLKSIATILSVAEGTCFNPEGGPEFLDGHISEWRERSTHDRCGMKHYHVPVAVSGAGFSMSGVFMHYMRSFIVCNFSSRPCPNAGSPVGLKCIRTRMTFEGFYDSKTLTMEERRYSTALNILPHNAPYGHYALCSIVEGTPQQTWNIWRCAPAAHHHVADRSYLWKRYGILPAGLYTGISMFQLQICSFIESWEQDWHATIDQIDSTISISPDVLEDFERLKALMMSNLSDSSVSYFKVLKILGIFATSVKSAPAYLEELIPWVRNPFVEDVWFEKTYPHTASSKAILKFNWDIVKTRQKEAADKILKRLERTTNEVQGLMDGVFNIQSIQEAQKSRTLNKYLFVFTLVTIIFLPPSLVATFFGTDIFNSSTNDKTEKKFWASVVAVSVVTYILAGMGLFGSGSQPERRSRWYQTMRDPGWFSKVKPFPRRYLTSHGDRWKYRTDEELDIETTVRESSS